MTAVLRMPEKYRFNHEKLRVLREAKGLSETDLASRVGVSENTVRNWEKGRSPPKFAKAAAICIALGVDFWDLLLTED